MLNPDIKKIKVPENYMVIKWNDGIIYYKEGSLGYKRMI